MFCFFLQKVKEVLHKQKGKLSELIGNFRATSLVAEATPIKSLVFIYIIVIFEVYIHVVLYIPADRTCFIIHTHWHW